MTSDPLLTINNLTVGPARRVAAVSDLSFALCQGEALALSGRIIRLRQIRDGTCDYVMREQVSPYSSSKRSKCDPASNNEV